ncbi:hypothetical protein K239x_17110 [Planctomycetes bacterium K23_9]|uniref:Uncharacterized protein n=1 Tax=Stieleria marina TaxID=1930275 RepID=A0A517NRK7_9BACT|nr:hypothetical protein K239x_17110 [Planctomycetes bacterium K23_9]
MTLSLGGWIQYPIQTNSLTKWHSNTQSLLEAYFVAILNVLLIGDGAARWRQRPMKSVAEQTFDFQNANTGSAANSPRGLRGGVPPAIAVQCCRDRGFVVMSR